MYSEQFLAYIASYKQEKQEKEEKIRKAKAHKPSFLLLLLRLFFHTT